MSTLKSETSSDPELNALKEIIIEGWPEKRKQVPKPLQVYWAYRDELSIENGLILKGDRIVIPEKLQCEILNKIHTAHQGVVKCQLRAKTCVFWNNINKDIEKLVKACPSCQEYGKSQPPEPLEPSVIPTRAWQFVASDLFSLQNEEFLLIADYYSKFFIVKAIPRGRSSSQTIINLLKDVFAEYGIPEKLMTDNGSQYASQSFKEFAKEWDFRHVTSSPRYPQSNGFIERQVQTVKSTIYKAKKTNTDVNLALLCLRSTPIDSQLPSPSELLHGRKTRSNLPAKIPNSVAHKDAVTERLQLRQDKQTSYFDKKAHELPPLAVGQQVRVQNQDTGRWTPATVQSKRPEPRSYEVESASGGILRRNRKLIRETGEKRVTFQEQADVQTDEGQVPPELVQHNEGSKQTYTTRSGRTVRKPERLDL